MGPAAGRWASRLPGPQHHHHICGQAPLCSCQLSPQESHEKVPIPALPILDWQPWKVSLRAICDPTTPSLVSEPYLKWRSSRPAAGGSPPDLISLAPAEQPLEEDFNYLLSTYCVFDAERASSLPLTVTMAAHYTKEKTALGATCLTLGTPRTSHRDPVPSSTLPALFTPQQWLVQGHTTQSPLSHCRTQPPTSPGLRLP